MKTKVLFFAAIMMAIFSFTSIDAMAQGGMGGGGMRGGGMRGGQGGGQQRPQMNLNAEDLAKAKADDLTKVLELNEDQTKEIYDIYLDITTRNIKTLKEKMESGERPTQRPEQGAEKAENGERPERPSIYTQTEEYDILATETAVKKILNDEQFTQWQKIKYKAVAPAKKERKNRKKDDE